MIPIIPIPKKAELSGEIRNLPLYITADPQWQGEIPVLQELFLQIFEKPLTVGEGGIRLCLDSSLAPDAYVLDVDSVATIFASGREGLLYGMATLLQKTS